MRHLSTYKQYENTDNEYYYFNQLVYSAIKNYFETFQNLLLDYDNIDAKIADKTLLYTLLDDDLGTKYIRETLKHKPNLNIKCDDDNETVLHLCIRNNDLQQYDIFTEQLLEMGADPNIQNNKKETPFMYSYNYKSLFKTILFKYNGDPIITDNKNKSVLDYMEDDMFDDDIITYLLENYPSCISKINKHVSDKLRKEYSDLFDSEELGLL